MSYGTELLGGSPIYGDRVPGSSRLQTIDATSGHLLRMRAQKRVGISCRFQVSVFSSEMRRALIYTSWSLENASIRPIAHHERVGCPALTRQIQPPTLQQRRKPCWEKKAVWGCGVFDVFTAQFLLKTRLLPLNFCTAPLPSIIRSNLQDDHASSTRYALVPELTLKHRRPLTRNGRQFQTQTQFNVCPIPPKTHKTSTRQDTKDAQRPTTKKAQPRKTPKPGL